MSYVTTGFAENYLISDSLMILFNSDTVVVPAIINPDLIDAVEHEEKLSTFNLSQNYPNPFNPGTKIKYSIPHTGFVTLKIYDILGCEIETLVHEEKPAGTYEVDFNGHDLPSGVYFYRLTSGSFVQTKKAVLLK